MGSPKLLDFAASQGWYDRSSGKPLSINRAYLSAAPKPDPEVEMEQMLRRRSRVRDLIGEFRDSDREPFPMWASGKKIVVPRQFAEVSGVGKFVM